MYEQIREHIRENEIPEALNAMDKLPLSAELKGKLLTLHRRWRIYENRAMSNLEEERLLRIEENQIVDDMITLLNRAEDSKGTVRQREVKVTYTEREAGATAGAGGVNKSSGGIPRWLLYAGGLALLLFGGVWLVKSMQGPDPATGELAGSTPPVTESSADREAPPSSTDTPESPPASDDAPPSSTERPTLRPATDLKIEDLSRVKELQVDPNILRNPRILDAIKANAPLMTEGSYIPMAIAVYYNEKAPTAYNEELTKTLGSFIRARIQREASMEVLTKAFHVSDMREKIVLRAIGGDARLKSSRAKYLLLCDIRQVSGDKGYLRMCLYDIARQKGFTRGKSITIRSGKSFQEKELLMAVQEYLTELKKRGLYE
ncbi:hypothetical protein [Neolewinella agarilytica]|uniref:Effector-associated domain-containing protein n=1 Tax=Neolewinella agarilytica TaxID=478744 RepID=A0A1H9J7W7_9BACT|nr:hypothetical protein [Neolewinella agarilytica]SEQ82829.1 hypothetical protein SAMN05444359_116120 [Neolewinella agarilytica]